MIKCKCGAEFYSVAALGKHIKSEKKKVDISALHSAAKKEQPTEIRPVEELYAAK